MVAAFLEVDFNEQLCQAPTWDAIGATSGGAFQCRLHFWWILMIGFIRHQFGLQLVPQYEVHFHGGYIFEEDFNEHICQATTWAAFGGTTGCAFQCPLHFWRWILMIGFVRHQVGLYFVPHLVVHFNAGCFFEVDFNEHICQATTWDAFGATTGGALQCWLHFWRWILMNGFVRHQL